jgi:RNA polymerase sigma-70 factor, ECF subfamily
MEPPPSDPPSPPTGDVTRLLDRVNAGDREALSDLLPMVYEELRSLASRYLSRERTDHTLQPTSLVHEAYLKLIDQNRAKWESRGHFMAIAATAMRRILVNHARDRKRLKRGGGSAREVLGDDASSLTSPDLDLVALDDALEKLATIDPRKVRIVEARFFVGLNVEDTAMLMGVSASTVKREWEFARIWLLREIESGG